MGFRGEFELVLVRLLDGIEMFRTKFWIMCPAWAMWFDGLTVEGFWDLEGEEKGIGPPDPETKGGGDGAMK